MNPAVLPALTPSPLHSLHPLPLLSAGIARRKIATKKALLHMSYDTWDKTESSCGTPHIGALRPLIPRTVMRAALVTGAVPVSSY